MRKLIIGIIVVFISQPIIFAGKYYSNIIDVYNKSELIVVGIPQDSESFRNIKMKVVDVLKGNIECDQIEIAIPFPRSSIGIPLASYNSNDTSLVFLIKSRDDDSYYRVSFPGLRYPDTADSILYHMINLTKDYADIVSLSDRKIKFEKLAEWLCKYTNCSATSNLIYMLLSEKKVKLGKGRKLNINLLKILNDDQKKVIYKNIINESMLSLDTFLILNKLESYLDENALPLLTKYLNGYQNHHRMQSYKAIDLICVIKDCDYGSKYAKKLKSECGKKDNKHKTEIIVNEFLERIELE